MRVVFRSDLLRAEANKAHDEELIKSLTARVEALESDLPSVKSSMAASVVELAKRIDALPVEFATDEAAYGLLKARLIEDLEEVLTPFDEQ